jgi:hypothetical protein
MLHKTIRHYMVGSTVKSTVIEWKIIGITLLKKTHFYPNPMVEGFQYYVKF